MHIFHWKNKLRQRAKAISGEKTYIFSAIESIRVMCIITLVKALASMRNSVDSRTAAAVIKSSRYTVLLRRDFSVSIYTTKSMYLPVESNTGTRSSARLSKTSTESPIQDPRVDGDGRQCNKAEKLEEGRS